MAKIFFLQRREQNSWKNPTHITEDGERTLCGKHPGGTILYEADWEALHYRVPFGELCPTCRKAAELHLRPRAVFWYLDPFNGDMKEFKSLRTAVSSAKKKHGNSTIWQLGPGDINKIVRFVEGRPVLP